ncbi:hypothetical protein [Labilibaculum filiforme]|uniref:hypothetical protein n=1 Tax=Labilibaculum filiforme TaxID=1940526 RepID=UPI00117BCD2B|nr:hypothetical protein [Labilibaculum filiforme]
MILIEGDLYFQMVDFFNFNNAPDSILTKIENQMTNIDLDTIAENDRKVYELIKYAIDQDVLRLPYIRLQTSENEKIMLYMDEDIYERFDSLKCFDLKKEGKKIHISALTNDISYKDIKAYKLIKLKVFEKIDGQTECRK